MTEKLNDIITALYNDTQLNECLEKFVPHYLRDDFKQELFIKLMQYPDSVLRASQNQQLRFFAVRVIISILREKRGSWERNYVRSVGVELRDEITTGPVTDPASFDERRMREERQDRVMERIRESEKELGSPYYRLLMEALLEHGNPSRVAKAVGIPRQSVYDGVKRIRKYLTNDN